MIWWTWAVTRDLKPKFSCHKLACYPGKWPRARRGGGAMYRTDFASCTYLHNFRGKVEEGVICRTDFAFCAHIWNGLGTLPAPCPKNSYPGYTVQMEIMVLYTPLHMVPVRVARTVSDIAPFPSPVNGHVPMGPSTAIPPSPPSPVKYSLFWSNCLVPPLTPTMRVNVSLLLCSDCSDQLPYTTVNNSAT